MKDQNYCYNSEFHATQSSGKKFNNLDYSISLALIYQKGGLNQYRK